MKKQKCTCIPLLWIAVLILIIGGVWYSRSYAPGVTPVPVDEQNMPPVDTNAEKVAKMIQVFSPAASTLVQSPLLVSGQAVGGWYFEASFPIELQKSDGTILAQTTGQAQGDWMTTNFVPFTATLTYPAQPSGSTGKLILKKDNPSGLPENDLQLVVPVQF